jgi:hypothetical protein
MSLLFSPMSLRSLTLPNRIVVSPMCQYVAKHGRATAWHLIHLGNMALSGAGLLCIEATAVEPEGRITAGDLGLWDDTTEAALRTVLAAIRQHAKIGVIMQLAHAGRKASSDVPWEGGQLVRPGIEAARRRLDQRLFGRDLAAAEDHSGARLPGPVRAGGEASDRRQHRCRRPDHPGATGRRGARERPGGSGRAGSRHALRPKMGLARRSRTRRHHRRRAAFILASAAA